MTWQALALHEADHVAVALRPLEAGQVVTVKTPGGLIEVTAVEAVPLCHKLALIDIGAGQPVLRYGQCIGETRIPVARGAWIHVHNLVSRRAKRPPARAT